jgi:dTDP-3,4-didehydro-2,6-dideoxy-alpha-D-glucose 3-reductase
VEPLNVGVVGCAAIAARMVIPAMMQSPHYNLVAVASRQQEKATDYATRFNCEAIVGYDALLQRTDINMVYIPLPTALHPEFAIKAFKAGKHVLLEKSLAVNYAEAREIVAAADTNKRLVQENFMFAFHRQFKLIKDILESGQLGELRCLRSSFGFPPFPDKENIRYQKELGGGALLDAGAYTIKIANLLLGSSLSVDAASMIIDEERNVDMHGSIYLTDANGIAFQSAYGFDHFYQCNLEIWGSKGKLTADRIFTAGPGIKPGIKIEFAGKTDTPDIEPDNHFLNLLENFSDTVQSGNFEKPHKDILNQANLLQEVRDRAKKTFSKKLAYDC